MLNRRWLLVSGCAFVACVALSAYALWPAGGDAEADKPVRRPAPDTSPIEIETITLEEQTFPLQAEATGYLVSWRRVEISAEVAAVVTQQSVQEGDHVRSGAMLVQLDDRRQRLELAEAQSNLLKVRTEYAVRLRLDVDFDGVDSSRFAEARKATIETQPRYDAGKPSEPSLQGMRDNHEPIAITSGVQRGAVQAATAGVTQAESRVAQARLELASTTVRAPFAGRVANVEAAMGQRIGPGDPLLTLLDDNNMKAEVYVLESDLVKIRPGVGAKLQIPALGDAVLDGTVLAVNPSIDLGRGTGRVTVAVPNHDGRLVSGMFAYVHLETEILRGRIAVPAKAVLARQGRDMVFVVEGGRAKWTNVIVGARSGSLVEITSGLNAGDVVAVSHHSALVHNAMVVSKSVAGSP